MIIEPLTISKELIKLMYTGLKKLTVAASLAGVLGFASASSAFATSTLHLIPANTLITGALKAGTKFTATATIDGIPVSASCTKLSVTGTTPANGLTVTATKLPRVSGCKDSLGGTDTVTANSTNGKWKITWISATKAYILVPKAGLTVTTSLLPGCVVTVAPTAPLKVTGTYDNVKKLSFKNVSGPVSGSGCPANATGKFSGTVVFTPGVSVVS